MAPHLDALPELRSELRCWLAEAGIDQQTAEDIVLAAWEVCANAVEHPVARRAGEVRLVASASSLGVRLLVEDTGSWRAHAWTRPGRGLGLRLARAMVDRVSIVRDRPGTGIVLWRSTRGHV